jgi:hypothetical protein
VTLIPCEPRARSDACRRRPLWPACRRGYCGAAPVLMQVFSAAEPIEAVRRPLALVGDLHQLSARRGPLHSNGTENRVKPFISQPTTCTGGFWPSLLQSERFIHGVFLHNPRKGMFQGSGGEVRLQWDGGECAQMADSIPFQGGRDVLE